MDSTPALDQLITARELRLLGVDARQYRHAIARGELVRIHRGVYVRADVWAGWNPSKRYEHQILGAIRASRSHLVVSHISAAAMWGAPLLTIPRLVHVLSANAWGTRVENGFHRHTNLAQGHGVVERDGLRLTSFARTLAEVAASVPFYDAVAILDWAFAPSTAETPKPVATAEQVRGAAGELGLFRGNRALERVLGFADGFSGSAGESLSRAMIFELGFPAPELQVEFRDVRGLIGIVDFWWPQFNLMGEFDGFGKYVREEYTHGKTIAEVVMAEKKREDRLRALDHGVTRWDWDTTRLPERMLAHLSEAGLRSSRRAVRLPAHR